MSRTKQERVNILGEELVNKKSVANSAVVFWGPEPVWGGMNFVQMAQYFWDNASDSQRNHISGLFFKEKTTADWMQLERPEKQKLVDYEVQISMGKALSWYNSMSDEDRAKKYFIAYASEKYPNLKKEIEKLHKVDPYHFRTIGHITRMATRGCPVLKSILADFEPKIKSLVKDIEIRPERACVVHKKDTRDPKVMELIGIIDEMLDNFGLNTKKPFPDSSLADAVLKRGGSNPQRGKVHEHFLKLIGELNTVLHGKDDELKEAYSYPKPNILKVYNWLTGAPSTELVQAARKSKKTRKKKAKTADQILRHFKPKAGDDEVGLTSIDPKDVLGAEQLWVYNAKTRRLGVFIAKNANGLGVERTSITNFDEATSICKRVRKPKEIVPTIVGMGKVALRKVISDIRAVETKLKSRINTDTILVRVVR